jgi:hypothetical protein
MNLKFLWEMQAGASGNYELPPFNSHYIVLNFSHDLECLAIGHEHSCMIEGPYRTKITAGPFNEEICFNRLV